MRVAVTYAEANKQALLEINVEDGCTAEAAIRRSGILTKFPHIDLSSNKVGVFGKAVNLDQSLHEGDRVEIYRPAKGSPPKKDRSGGGDGEEGAAKSRPAPRAKTASAEEAPAPAAPAASADPAPTEEAPAKAAPSDEERAARIAAAKARAAAAKAKATPSA